MVSSMPSHCDKPTLPQTATVQIGQTALAPSGRINKIKANINKAIKIVKILGRDEAMPRRYIILT